MVRTDPGIKIKKVSADFIFRFFSLALRYVSGEAFANGEGCDVGDTFFNPSVPVPITIGMSGTPPLAGGGIDLNI